MKGRDTLIELVKGHALDVLANMPENRLFDAVITDPPYASGASTQSGVSATTAKKYTGSKSRCPFPDFEGDAMDKRSWATMMTLILEIAREHTQKGGVIVLFADWRQLPLATDVMQWAGWIWRGIALWDKENSRPQKGRFRQQAEFLAWGSNGSLPPNRPVPCLPGVFAVRNVTGAERIHQTQKPLELMRDVVRICTPGGSILDPFAGSGSTLEAAKLEGFDALGIELSAPIYQSAKQRLGLD